jgi:hypothetical protein
VVVETSTTDSSVVVKTSVGSSPVVVDATVVNSVGLKKLKEKKIFFTYFKVKISRGLTMLY